MSISGERIVHRRIADDATLECVRHRPDAALPTRLQLGAPVQKLFPGVAGGAGYVKAVSAALPMLNINPTVSVFLFH